MEEEKDLIILTKYIVVEANDDEKKFIVKWLSEDASRETLYVELKAAWHESDFYENSNRIDVDRTYDLFREKISKPKRKGFVIRSNPFKPN